MNSSEFPPNSEASKRRRLDSKDITPVTVTGAARKRKSTRKRFSETFVAGDAKTAFQYVIFEVLLPAARDTMSDAISQGVDRLIFGDSRRRGATPPYSGPTGHIEYNRYSPTSRLSSHQRAISRRARARHDFDEIVLDERVEAEEVIDRLFDLVSRYESASVADLYELVGLSSTHTDHKWGWTDLQGAGVSRIRGGYLLDLPEPEPLD
jgi:hypothetical protein